MYMAYLLFLNFYKKICYFPVSICLTKTCSKTYVSYKICEYYFLSNMNKGQLFVKCYNYSNNILN